MKKIIAALLALALVPLYGVYGHGFDGSAADLPNVSETDWQSFVELHEKIMGHAPMMGLQEMRGMAGPAGMGCH